MRHFYLHDQNNHKAVCVAVETQEFPERHSIDVTFAAATYNPHDAHIGLKRNDATARNKAIGRLKGRNLKVKHSFTFDMPLIDGELPGKQFHRVMDAVVRYIAYGPWGEEHPAAHSAHYAANQWLAKQAALEQLK